MFSFNIKVFTYNINSNVSEIGYGQKEVAKISNNPVLVADPFPPYQYMLNNSIVGLDYYLIMESFKKMKVDVKIQLYNWDECLNRVIKGLADGIFQIVKIPERERIFLFSEKLRSANVVVVKRRDLEIKTDIELNLINQISRYKIGLMDGYSYGDYVDQLDKKKLVRINDQKNLLRQLVDKKFELALIDYGVARYLIEKLGCNEILEIVKGFNFSRDLYVAFNKSKLDLVHIFNQGLRRMKSSGDYQKLFKQYKVL